MNSVAKLNLCDSDTGSRLDQVESAGEYLTLDFVGSHRLPSKSKFVYKQDHFNGLPKSSQDKSNGLPKYPGLWERITQALGTNKTGEIAKTLQIRDSSVSEWKHKNAPPGVENLLQIAKLGNTSIEWLLTGEGVAAIPKEAERPDEKDRDPDERFVQLSHILLEGLREEIVEIARQVFREEMPSTFELEAVQQTNGEEGKTFHRVVIPKGRPAGESDATGREEKPIAKG